MKEQGEKAQRYGVAYQPLAKKIVCGALCNNKMFFKEGFEDCTLDAIWAVCQKAMSEGGYIGITDVDSGVGFEITVNRGRDNAV